MLNLGRSAVGMRAALIAGCIGGYAFGTFPETATKTLLDSRPGLVARHERERITALYGVPIETDADPQTSTDQFVNWFISQHADAFGVDGVHLHQVRPADYIRGNKFAVYTFEQRTSDNVPVHGTIVKIPVLLGTTEKIGYVGIRLIPLPATFPSDSIDGEDALEVLNLAQYQHLTSHTQPVLVVYEDPAGAVRRCWRFVAWAELESYFFFVNAADGELISV